MRTIALAGSVAEASSDARALFIRRTYDTSKIIHSYNPEQHVAAALELFASVALLFWHILRILMRARR
jgi:FtsH-binding integral membrane protein